MTGLVLKSTGSWYEVKTPEGKFIRCRLRGKMKLRGIKITNPVTVGDEVNFVLEGSGEGIIEEIQPRRNYIIRKSTRKTAYGHILAANIDQAVLIASLIFPRTSTGFIDRYLVAAESFRIPALIIFNKSDLLDRNLMNFYSDLEKLYNSLGYRTMLLSALNDRDFKSLMEELRGKKSLFTGHSGVGKSTILNRLEPSLELRTGEVSTFADKGIHTTTFATMHELTEGTYVIDTPGIKELGLIDMEEWEISHYFPEMRDKLGECKFHNCLHINEPGCEVIDAVKKGEISESRYYNYISMIIDEDTHR